MHRIAIESYHSGAWEGIGAADTLIVEIDDQKWVVTEGHFASKNPDVIKIPMNPWGYSVSRMLAQSLKDHNVETKGKNMQTFFGMAISMLKED